MPDAWETSQGLNPNDASDRNSIYNEGFTYLEFYLNSITSSEKGIYTEGSLSVFNQTIGTPSGIKTYQVSGSGLSGDLVITPPVGFEVSANSGTNWFNNASPLTITQSNGAVMPTIITVRLNSNLSGSYHGNISHTSTGITTVNLPLSGIAKTASTTPAGTSVVVAKDGSGNFTTVQAAIDAAPTNSSTPYIIYIKNGIYKEKIVIESNKTFIHLIGESAANTILTYDDYSGKAMPGGGTFGTSNSASVHVKGADFMAMNITFENTTGDNPQALAINVQAERAAFKNCRFLGGQDTVLTNGSGNKQYYKGCYIDGVVDFIFGDARAVFDDCIVYAKSRQDGLGGSYITAANTKSDQTYGYVFRNCILPSNTGFTQYVLGRPWQNSSSSNPRSAPKVVFLNTVMGDNQVKPEGWSIWDAGTVTSEIYYGEYKSKKYNGTLVDVSQRVAWSFQLSDAEANAYTNANLFESWNPCVITSGFCDNITPEIAVSNFKAKKNGSTSDISWNISWAMTGIKYELFRSSDNISFEKINEQTAADDININFSYSEAVPPPGKTYYYYLVASKNGFNPHQTATVEVSSTETITVTGTLSDFLQGLGTPSGLQAYSVSGVNLSQNVVITPPAGYEVSVNGTNWYNNSNPLSLSPTSGTLATTTISVRLNATSVGTYNGSINHTSLGAASIQLPVKGTVQSDALPVSETLLYWALTSNNQDDAASRSAGLLSSSPTLHRFSLSNGTQVPSVPAYSATYGQAFGGGTSGEGLWTTANGGPGGNLNRAYYEEFTVKSKTGYQIRIDSIAFNASYYSTSSNTKLAIVYSKKGFTTSDSTDVSGGKGPDGNALLSSANGAFATPVFLANQTGETTNNYRFALAGTDGVTIQSGEILTIRLYFSCGSTSPGRYAKLKDVYIKGNAKEIITPTSVLHVSGALNSFTQTLGTASEVQTYTVSGADLTGNVVITPPVGYQVSANGGLTWFSAGIPLALTPSSGNLASTTISVRLNANIEGSYNGNITHASTNATSVQLPVSGVTEATPTALEDGIASRFYLSPNPTYDKLVVHSVEGEKSQITISNILGKKMITSQADFSKGDIIFDIAHWSSGVYLIEFSNGNKKGVLRFVKY